MPFAQYFYTDSKTRPQAINIQYLVYFLQLVFCCSYADPGIKALIPKSGKKNRLCEKRDAGPDITIKKRR